MMRQQGIEIYLTIDRQEQAQEKTKNPKFR